MSVFFATYSLVWFPQTLSLKWTEVEIGASRKNTSADRLHVMYCMHIIIIALESKRRRNYTWRMLARLRASKGVLVGC